MPDLHSVARRLARGRGLKVAAAATALAAAAVLAAIMAFAGRGFDLTDEAYYVLSMQEPAAYRMTSTLFGYALRPVYLLLGGSIFGLRVFGVLALAALGAAAMALVLASRRQPGTSSPARRERGTMQSMVEGARPAEGVAAALVAGAVLPAMYDGFWLPTPSYNWLVLAAALLLLPAILLLADRDRGPALPAALAALAGLIAALAKPPTAAAYAVLFLAAAILLLREPRRIAAVLALAFAFTAAGLAVLAALLPLETVWAQTKGYMQMHGAAPPAGSGVIHDLLAFLVRPRGWPVVAAAVAAGLAARRDPAMRTRRIAAALATAAIAVAAVRILLFRPYPNLGPGMAAVAYGAIALALIGGADRRLCLALALSALLPLGAAVGTTNDTPSQTSLHAGLFGLVALIAAASVRRTEVTTFAALALVLLTGAAVWKGLARPYRLAAPLWRQTETVEIGRHGTLKLDPRTAAFIRALREGAVQRGFCAGDPVVDLTGELPGVAVALGGKTPGLPWLFGGYPFSETLAAWALAGVDAPTLGRAWLVVGENRTAFPGSFVRALGFPFPDAYDPTFEGAHPLHGTPVRLYRPRAAAGASCPGPGR
ncbi:MAG TPA: hypothetical protein VF601_11060 [Beijerinckiaceae bacterium]|jgi:hypothetical protein